MYYLYSCYDEIHGPHGVIIIHIVVVNLALVTITNISVAVIEVEGGQASGQNTAYLNIYQ